MEKLLSVLVPVCNVEQYLEQCLDSILAQRYWNLQIVCIDDGSRDRSGDILDAYAKKDDRIEVVHRENGGYGSAMNLAISLAKGDYIGIVEPDDYIHDLMYEKLLSKTEGIPDIVRCNYLRICNAGTPEEEIRPSYSQGNISCVDRPFTLGQCADLLFYHPSIWTGIYSREFLRNNGIRFIEAPGAGWVDNPFFIETLCRAKSIIYIDEALYFYREFNDKLAGGQKNPSILADRWIEMNDIISSLNITNPNILEGHANRGCSHILMLQEDFPPFDKRANKAISDIVRRIDADIVTSSSKIIPEYKRAFEKATRPVLGTLSKLKRLK